MAKSMQDFELIRLLNLPAGDVVDERSRRWAEAFEAWLEARRTGYHPTVGPRSHLAWREFLALTCKPPWQVRLEDVNAYATSLDESGLRPSTIGHRLAELGSFYAYCQEHRVDAHCGPDFNPVKGARRPRVINYEKVRGLSPKEEAALLGAIQCDGSPIGKRDYALFLALLRTGWKSSQVRTLTWGEVGRRGDRETGSAASLIGEGVPAEVWEAIREYLEATGRWEGIREEEYVFVPLRNPLVNERQDRAQDWDAGRPLSARQLQGLLKRHAEMAGLKAGAITCHTLRHTAALRRLKSGQSLDAVAAYLGRTGKRANRYYLRQLQKSPRGRLQARKRGILARQQAPSRQPHRFQPRNHMALTHGLKAKYLPEFELLAKKGIRLDPLDAAVLRWRIVIKRVTIVWNYIETFEEAVPLLKAMGQACMHLVRAIKLREQIRAMMPEIEAEVVMADWWGEEELPPEED